MKKKLICLLLTAVMLFSLAACTFVEPENKQTEAPTNAPTNAPTDAPTDAPTEAPSAAPTEAADETPTEAPTEAPTNAPVTKPTAAPTQAPTDAPTESPTEAPTDAPVEDTYVAPRNYEEYLALSGDDLTRFMESFPSVDDFFDWVKAERKKYEDAKDKIQVGSDGIIDLG
jgi:hypothetical protein